MRRVPLAHHDLGLLATAGAMIATNIAGDDGRGSSMTRPPNDVAQLEIERSRPR